MLVVQIYTAESGVCATCFVTALYWKKDRLLHQTQRNFLNIQTNIELLTVAGFFYKITSTYTFLDLTPVLELLTLRRFKT